MRAYSPAPSRIAIITDLPLPRPIPRHPYISRLATAVKVYLHPHLSAEDSQTQNNYQIVAMIALSRTSQSLDEAAEGSETALSITRLTAPSKTVLPIVRKESTSSRVGRMLTKSKLSPRCSKEDNRRVISDKNIYKYTLNDWEQAIPKDYTGPPKLTAPDKRIIPQCIVRAALTTTSTSWR